MVNIVDRRRAEGEAHTEAILGALRAADGLTLAEVGAATGLSERRARTYLGRLLVKGRVRNQAGRFVVAAPPPAGPVVETPDDAANAYEPAPAYIPPPVVEPAHGQVAEAIVAALGPLGPDVVKRADVFRTRHHLTRTPDTDVACLLSALDGWVGECVELGEEAQEARGKALQEATNIIAGGRAEAESLVAQAKETAKGLVAEAKAQAKQVTDSVGETAQIVREASERAAQIIAAAERAADEALADRTKMLDEREAELDVGAEAVVVALRGVERLREVEAREATCEILAGLMDDLRRVPKLTTREAGRLAYLRDQGLADAPRADARDVVESNANEPTTQNHHNQTFTFSALFPNVR